MDRKVGDGGEGEVEGDGGGWEVQAGGDMMDAGIEGVIESTNMVAPTEASACGGWEGRWSSWWRENKEKEEDDCVLLVVGLGFRWPI